MSAEFQSSKLSL